VQAFIRELTDRLTKDGHPDFASVVIPYDQGRIEDGGQYGDPLRRARPDFVQQVYDEMAAEGLVPSETVEDRPW
jgi:hypothetical protein